MNINEDLSNINNLIKDILNIKFVREIFFKKMSNYANTTDLSNLKELDICRCLICDKEWNSLNVIPNDSHNFSKDLILKPLAVNERVVVINKTRPMTIIHSKRNLELDELNKKDFEEKIENALTFGGVCKECDKIYNKVFEEKGNLNFKNQRHLNLFVERASVFKYYREKRMTKIIEYILKLNNKKNIDPLEWAEYLALRSNLKAIDIVRLRNSLYEKEKIIFKSKNKDMIHKVKDNYNINDIIFTDALDIQLEDHTLINLVILKGVSYLILSRRRKNKEENIEIDDDKTKIIESMIKNFDFKDMVLTKNYFMKNFYGKSMISCVEEGIFYSVVEKSKIVTTLINKQELKERGLDYENYEKIKCVENKKNNTLEVREENKSYEFNINNRQCIMYNIY